MKNGNLLKLCVREISVKRIRVNQGVDVLWSELYEIVGLR